MHHISGRTGRRRPTASGRWQGWRLCAAILLAVVCTVLPQAAWADAGVWQAAAGRGGEVTRVAALYFACSGVYLLMGLSFFIFWRWLRRDLPMLALGVLCVMMAVHSAGISGTLSIVFPAFVDAEANAFIEIVSYVLLSGLIACLLWAFFPHTFYPRASSLSHRLNTAIALIAALASAGLVVAAVISAGDPQILALGRWVTVALMIVVAVIAVRTLRSRVENRRFTFIGFSLLVAGSVHDVLLAGIGDAGHAYLVPFGLLGFVLLQSYVMIRRTAEATLRAQISGKRLRREVDERTKELRAATEAAQAANLAKTEFVTAVTHELRTPLASILGYVRLLRDELTVGLNAEQTEFFDTVEESGERLLNLVNKLLDLARIESGHIELNLEQVDPAEILDQVCSELYPLAKEKNLFLRKEVEVADARVLADEQWLSVVLSDLVSNAIKYTGTGGVTMRVERDSEDAVAIRITDTGPGISKEFMPRLFERFSREDHARSGAPTGTGLGLTISRELLGLMGGEIRVESELGVGSTFTVLLPDADREAGSVTSEKKTARQNDMHSTEDVSPKSDASSEGQAATDRQTSSNGEAASADAADVPP